SLTVLTGQDLESDRARTTNDLTDQVAELTTTNLGAGQDKVFLRGLTDSIVPGLSESMVGIYLDEARIGDDAPDPDLRLVDIERVEVLNGPQGTLYGAGSLGGLLRIVTHKPETDEYQAMFEASIADTKHGDLSSGFETMLNVPIVTGVLAARFV